MLELRALRREPFPDMKADAGISFLAVPIAPIPFHFTQPHRQLIRRRFDFLETHDVGLHSLQPALQLCLPGADAVHVPGRDLHRSIVLCNVLASSDAVPRPDPAGWCGTPDGYGDCDEEN